MILVPPKTSQGYFFERNIFPENSGISVLSTRYNVINYRPETRTFSHPFWVLDYTYGNCGLCQVGRRTNAWLKRSAGHMHLYAPETSYRENSALAQLPLLSSFMTFYGGKELDLVKHVNNGDGFGRFIDKSGKAGELLVEAASEAAQGREISYWSVMSKFYGIVDLIHSAQALGDGNEKSMMESDDDGVRNREASFVEDVRKYLQENVRKTVSIADLAGQLNASASTVSHKYRELTGESPMKTLTTFRINAVKNLLAKGESIKFISSQTGFYDEFHLSKVFKKAIGSSPSAYQKRFQSSLNTM